MHNWLAAILLVPASWCVFNSPRRWLTAFATGPTRFFSIVVKSAPRVVRRSPSRWRNIFVYWPMKAGIDLVRSRSVRAVLRKMWRVLQGTATATLAGGDTPCVRVQPPHISSDEIKGMIRQSAIKVVSFDIFDTLLVRPVLQPKDIFYLIAAKVDPLYGINFVEMRWNAEEQTGNPNATIHDIYACIQRTYKLDKELTCALLDEEIHCEATLLAPREDMRLCYDEAVKQGKRIIAVSDMYLPEDVLLNILQKSGYTQLSALYVSCAYGKRKSDGTLYEHVITQEHIHPSEILHIGDNYSSDYCAALTRHVTAVYSPPPYAQCLAADPDFSALVNAAAHKDPAWSPLLAFALHRACTEAAKDKRIANLADGASFAAVTVAPLLTGYCLSLVGDTALQQHYTQLHFASRDGYLPHKIYTAIARYVPCLPAVYFYAGRRAYYPFLYTSFYEYAASLKPASDIHYTLYDFITAHFSGTDMLKCLEAGLTDEEKRLSFMGEQRQCLRVLKRFEAEIETFMDAKRARIRKYYATVFPPQEKSVLVFDLGYSGSIGQALSAATGKTVNKLYFWETDTNRERDKAYGSHTQLFMRDPSGCIPHNLLFEELFSPCAGGVVDFDENAMPILEALYISAESQSDMTMIHTTCLDFTEAFCTQLGEYARHVRPASGDVAVDICRFLLTHNPYCNQRLFKNSMFPDPLHYAEVCSLERKLDNFLPYNSVFAGTGFDDPRLVLTPERPCATSLKLGMHIHLHNLELADEIIRYLHNFPAHLDIYITITDQGAARTVGNLFSQARIPCAQHIRVLSVPNRGRDIAPWILGMRPYQDKYDLFCHIHAKESLHFDFGNAWRDYLLGNLLLPDAVGDILTLFQQDPQLGCVFPPIFPPLMAFMAARDISPAGLKDEAQLVEVLLRRMGLRGELCRSEIFFSVGTMLWYRPPALHQLFSLDLGLEEFAAEPIGVEGTLAHAIERMPALIATRNGYRVGTFARRA